MKKYVSVLLCFVIFAVLGCIYSVYGNTSDKDICIRMLSGYGWEVESEPTEAQSVTIPQQFDLVYENYNELQKGSGFDLVPYRGKSGTRYTFIVTNYPVDVGEIVYANVITIDGTAIGGDIMTVSLSGFMHGIAENTP